MGGTQPCAKIARKLHANGLGIFFPSPHPLIMCILGPPFHLPSAKTCHKGAGASFVASVASVARKPHANSAQLGSPMVLHGRRGGCSYTSSDGTLSYASCRRASPCPLLSGNCYDETLSKQMKRFQDHPRPPPPYSTTQHAKSTGLNRRAGTQSPAPLT